MAEQTVEVSDQLWVKFFDADSPEDDGLLTIYDAVGGECLVDFEELEDLIRVLQTLVEEDF